MTFLSKDQLAHLRAVASHDPDVEEMWDEYAMEQVILQLLGHIAVMQVRSDLEESMRDLAAGRVVSGDEVMAQLRSIVGAHAEQDKEDTRALHCVVYNDRPDTMHGWYVTERGSGGGYGPYTTAVKAAEKLKELE